MGRDPALAIRGRNRVFAKGFLRAMTNTQMTPEEVELDRQWRTRFGQPLPMLGSAELVWRILATTPADRPAAVDAHPVAALPVLETK